MAEDKMRFTARTVADLENGCDVVIVAFGDSITAGYAVRRGFLYFWREMLQKKYPEASIELINSGISGDTTVDGLARLEWDVLSYEPDLVSINFGINDAVMSLPLQEFQDNLRQMVRRIRSGPGSEILLLSSQPLETSPYDRMVLSYYRALEQVAHETDLGFVDVYAAWKKRLASQKASLSAFILEGLDHPNEDGYRMVAEELMSFF